MSTTQRTALVTGAARGIGRAIVTALAADGWQVVAGVRDVATAEFDDPNVTVVTLDVSDPASVRNGVGEAERVAGGALDAVVNNAGHALVSPVELLDLDAVRGMFEVNTFGAVSVVQAALPAMRAARRGRIVFVSTVGSYLYTPFLSSYRASKAALNAFADVLAVEVREFGIHVSRVEPGMVATEFSKSTQGFPTLLDAESPYAPLVQTFVKGFREWREWVNIPAEDVAEEVVRLIDDPDPAAAVLVGEDALHLVELDEPGMRAFLGLDDR